jgi:hypothetical protein
MAFSSDQPLVSNQLPISIDFPKETDEFLVEITETYKRIANVVNTKVGGLYNPTELATYKQLAGLTALIPLRNVYRKTLDLVAITGGNIAPAAVIVVPHGITSLTNTMIIYASCTSVTPTFFTVVYPYVFLDAVNVNFTNPLAVALTQCQVICEFTKS